jgi:hypothetical protein
MGLFNKIKDPVQGTAQVVACSGAPDNAASTIGGVPCAMNLVLTAPGVEATAIETRKRVPGKKHPYSGMILPATIDRSDPERFEIDWDQVPTHDERARQQTEAAAEAMRDGTGTPGVPLEAQGIVGQLGDMFPGAQIHVEGGAGGG